MGPIEIKNIKVTYISTKTDKFNNTRCYFNVSDSKTKKRLTPILSQTCEECRLPLWKTEDGQYMLKVKSKFAPQMLECQSEHSVKLLFKYYCMENDDGKLNQGYYTIMSKTGNDNDSDAGSM